MVFAESTMPSRCVSTSRSRSSCPLPSQLGERRQRCQRWLRASWACLLCTSLSINFTPQVALDTFLWEVGWRMGMLKYTLICFNSKEFFWVMKTIRFKESTRNQQISYKSSKITSTTSTNSKWSCPRINSPSGFMNLTHALTGRAHCVSADRAASGPVRGPAKKRRGLSAA